MSLSGSLNVPSQKGLERGNLCSCAVSENSEGAQEQYRPADEASEPETDTKGVIAAFKLDGIIILREYVPVILRHHRSQKQIETRRQRERDGDETLHLKASSYAICIPTSKCGK